MKNKERQYKIAYYIALVGFMIVLIIAVAESFIYTNLILKKQQQYN